MKSVVSEQRARAVEAGLRTLSKDEIDRRIEGVLTEVASRLEGESAQPASALRPLWVSPAGLVLRMRRFLVFN